VSAESPVTFDDLDKHAAEATRDLRAKVQKDWASLGGLGPAPAEFRQHYVFKREAYAEAEEHARGLIAQQRHELRMRFIERALEGLLAHIGDAEPKDVAGIADAQLDYLAEEAKASAKEGAT
jgi:hypothetical protein